MAYRIMKALIAQGNRTKEELSNKADVFYGAGRMTVEEYRDIIERINKMVQTLM